MFGGNYAGIEDWVPESGRHLIELGGPRLTPALSPSSSGTRIKSVLSYPMNVDTDPEFGHMIVFYFMINDSNKDSHLEFTDRNRGVHIERFLDKENKTTRAIRDRGRNTGGSAATGKVNPNSITNFMKNELGAATGFASPEIIRSNLSVGLYMPSELVTTYTHNYSQAKTGGMILSALSTNLKSLVEAGGKGFENMQSAWKGSKGVLGGAGAVGKIALKSAIRGAANSPVAMAAVVTAGSSDSVMALPQAIIRKAFNPRMEFLYQGTSPRTFTYTFKMIPHNEREANEIRNIVARFKEHSHPKLDSSTDNFIHFPNQFEIEYMAYSETNNYLNKISTCVLTSMSVNYTTENQPQFLRTNADGAPPLTTTMTLSFSETEVLTADRISRGNF